MPDQVYYISTSPGVTEGPFALQDLTVRKLPTHTQVFTRDANEWLPINHYPELVALLTVSVPNESESALDADKAPEDDAVEGQRFEQEDSSVTGGWAVDSPETEKSGVDDEPTSEVWELQEWDEVMRRKRAVKTALVICTVVAGASAVSSWHIIGVLERMRNGSFSSDEEMMRTAELGDAFEAITGIGFLLAYIASAVFFVRWFQHLYRSLYDRVELKWNKSAGAWSWFIPFVNYFRPVQIANKMIEESADDEDGKGMVGVWWAFWVISIFVDRFGPSWSDYMKDDASISELIHQSQWTIVSMIFTVIAGLTALGAVNAISKAAETWPAKPAESPNPM
jgi:hypothetical protein